jgi:Flp pilus assembly protein TadB
MTVLLAAALGAGFGLGLLLLATGIGGKPMLGSRSGQPSGIANRIKSIRVSAVQLVAGLVAGVTVWLIVGWAVPALIAVAIVLALPGLLGRRTPKAAPTIARLEALGEWCRRLGDLLASGHSIEEAITASRRTVPGPIREEVGTLVARLRAGAKTQAALRAFADELADPSADLVVLALLLASRRRGAQLGSVLEGLASSVADEVVMRRRVEADRAKPRTTARLIMLLSVGAAVGMAALQPDYLAGYDSFLGQVILAALALAMAGLWWWMRALAAPKPLPRLLKPAPGARP